MKIGANQFNIPSDAKVEEFMALAELGRQAQVIFHDLANHFTSLNLTIEELENNLMAEKERFKEYSKRSNETRAQMEYVANLLRSHMQGKNEPFRADMVTREIVSLFKDKAIRDSIGVKLTLDKNISFLNSKRDFIHIVTNLVGNAIESFATVSKRKNKEIRVELKQNLDQVILSISDNGCGINKENIKKIFKSSFTTKKNGHGIGLTAVKEKVDMVFGGSIKVQSSRAGTCFKVIIPKQKMKQNLLPVFKPNINLRLERLESLRNRSIA